MEWFPENYEALIPLIQKALDELEETRMELTPRQILEVLSGDAPNGEVEAACRFFARSWKVQPELPDCVRLAMSFRLRCARWYCHEVAPHSDGESAEKMLWGILTEYWDDVGRFDWIQEDLLAGDYSQPE